MRILGRPKIIDPPVSKPIPKRIPRAKRAPKKEDMCVSIIVRHEPDASGADYEVSPKIAGECPADIDQEDFMDFLKECLDSYFLGDEEECEEGEEEE